MASERAERLRERMLEQSAVAAPFHLPQVPNQVLTPVSEAERDTILRRIDGNLMEADGFAAQVEQNLLGAINRGTASGQAAQAMLSNAIQLPVTLAANEAGSLYGGVGTNVVNGITRQLGEISELQSMGMPGLATLAGPVPVPVTQAEFDYAVELYRDKYTENLKESDDVVGTWTDDQIRQFITMPIQLPLQSPTGGATYYPLNLPQPSGTLIPIPASMSSVPANIQSAVQPQGLPYIPSSNDCLFGNPSLITWAQKEWPAPEFGVGVNCAYGAEAQVADFVAVKSRNNRPYWVEWYPTDDPYWPKFAVMAGTIGGPLPHAPRTMPPAGIAHYGNVGVTRLGMGSPSPSPVPLPLPPPIPEQPRPPVPPPPAPCIKICGFGDETPKEPDDPCETCDGSIWFNTQDCSIKLFIKGCGPPRTEDHWRELGETSDIDQLRRLYDEHCHEEEEEGGGGGTSPGGGGNGIALTPARFCNFLPVAASLTRFSTPALLSASLHIAAAAIGSLPGWTGARTVAGVIDAFASFLDNFRGSLDGWVESIIRQFLGATDCTDGRAAGLYLSVALLGVIDKWLCTGLDDLALPFRQQARAACPTGIPSASEATMAHLANTMEYEEWRCLVRGNNYKEDQYEKIARAMRRKLEPLQLVILRARDVITADAYNERMRELGYISQEEVDFAWMSSRWLPGPSDIIRFMVRDAGDQAVVNQFGLDEEFGPKYSNELKDLAKGNRVDDRTMQLYWRAHWQIPSPTQLFDFYRRLRKRPALWPSGNPESDMRAALIQQDILPKWIDAFMALTFTPLTRVDARRMLEQDVIDESEAVTAWEQLGYSTENAQSLVKLASANAQRQAVKHPVVKRLANGELPLSDATIILRSENVPERFDRLIFERAAIESAASRRKKCIAGIRKRFLLGEFSAEELIGVIMAQGVDTLPAQQIAAGMVCVRSSQGKQIAAATLTGWYIDALLSAGDFMTRLLRLGYKHDDAVLIVRQAELHSQRRKTREEKARLREEEADRRRIESDRRREEAEQRRIANEAETEQAKAERRREKLERAAHTAEQRAAAEAEKLRKAQFAEHEQRQITTAQLYADVERKFDLTTTTAVNAVDSLFQQLVGLGTLTQSEVLGTMAEALTTEDATTVADWRQASADMANSRIAGLPVQLP